MASKTSIRTLINKTEAEYETCWGILASMKSGIYSNDSVLRMLDFQPILAAALFSLDKIYHEISHEKKSLIAKKNQLNDKWFRNRMATLDKYQKMLMDVVEIGKALGDTFAWFFYQNAREYLQAHAKHEVLTHMPPGDGGLGELHFIRNIKSLDGNLIIYHGTTTFLRLGDVSLIDLKTLTVTAIGDIKTVRKSESEIQIELYFVGEAKPNETISVRSDQSGTSPIKQLPQQIRQKLEKQMDKMAKSFILPQIAQNAEIEANDHTKKLNELFVMLKESNIAYQKAGDGLLLVGLKRKLNYSFYANLFGHSLRKWQENLSSLPEQTVTIIDTEQAGLDNNCNSIILNHLTPRTMIGAVPMFWWPVETEFLHKIFFREAVVFSIYNPAHLAKKLRSIGFQVSLGAKGKLNATKHIEDKKIEIENIDYFTQAIRLFLWNEEFAVRTILRVLQDVENGVFPVQTKIEMAIIQTYRQSAPDIIEDAV